VDRRDFLKRLLGTAAGVALASTYDLEKLLWVPKPMITVPALNIDQLNAIVLKEIMPGIVDNFFKSTPLLQYMKERHAKTFHGEPIQSNSVWRLPA
jgi:hypothetical protein